MDEKHLPIQSFCIASLSPTPGSTQWRRVIGSYGMSLASYIWWDVQWKNSYCQNSNVVLNRYNTNSWWHYYYHWLLRLQQAHFCCQMILLHENHSPKWALIWSSKSVQVQTYYILLKWYILFLSTSVQSVGSSVVDCILSTLQTNRKREDVLLSTTSSLA